MEDALEPSPRDGDWQDGDHFGDTGAAAVKERVGTLVSSHMESCTIRV